MATSYIPSTYGQQQEMLSAMGLTDVEQLLTPIPAQLRVRDGLRLPAGKSEQEVSAQVRALAAQNHVFSTVFRGAGAYRHYIPSVVKDISSREEFVTAYTPYQAELSQGVLQAIFEYQTMICRLTGMAASNASVYDGATAAAEAVMMCRERSRSRVLVSAAVHPMTLRVIQTYCAPHGLKVTVVPVKDGVTDLSALSKLCGPDVACVLTQQPNYFGCLEAADAIGQAVHACGAKWIFSANPLSLALFRTPAAYGADIAVGDAQPFGMPLSFGGPYLGYMACTQPLVRKLPGRIVGETEDAQGRRAYVLTLQAREQHIRREKASSSLCSNQALCALTASVYLAAMGPKGLCETASLCYQKAHYAARRISALPGFSLSYSAPFFHEFVTDCPVSPDRLMAALEKEDILGGLPLHDGRILWCVTELNTCAEIDRLVSLLQEMEDQV